MSKARLPSFQAIGMGNWGGGGDDYDVGVGGGADHHLLP